MLGFIESGKNGSLLCWRSQSGRRILEEMSHLDSTWLWYEGKRKPEHVIEAPTETQSEVLRAFGWEIGTGGVLRGLND